MSFLTAWRPLCQWMGIDGLWQSVDVECCRVLTTYRLTSRRLLLDTRLTVARCGRVLIMYQLT